jgi:predicted nucleotidyltransferase
MQKEFLHKALNVIQQDENVLGVAVGGSWIESEIDRYSDLDLVIVTNEAIAPDIEKMQNFAKKIGSHLHGFRGDHVGEKRLWIALYEDPLLHVDLKFVTVSEFRHRVEDPTVVWEKGSILTTIIDETTASWPAFSYQQAEDRFWGWIHYSATKLGRGEYLETLGAIGLIRDTILGPLLLLKHGQLPRGVRKVEMNLPEEDLKKLYRTVSLANREDLIHALEQSISLYRELREYVFPQETILHTKLENQVVNYVEEVKNVVD